MEEVLSNFWAYWGSLPIEEQKEKIVQSEVFREHFKRKNDLPERFGKMTDTYGLDIVCDEMIRFIIANVNKNELKQLLYFHACSKCNAARMSGIMQFDHS